MRARVNYRERNLSLYAPVGVTFGAALILPMHKGKRNKVLSFTNKNQLLKTVTSNGSVEVGTHVSIFSALKILESTSNLLVVIPDAEGSLRAGVSLFQNTQPVALNKGVKDPQAYDFASESNNCSILITAANEGKWGNDLLITNHFYKTDEKVTKDGTDAENESKKDFELTLTQKWGNGYPVKIYSRTMPKELDNNTVYFLRNVSGNTYKLFETQSDAVGSGTSPVQVTKAQAGDYFVSPAYQYTKIPNTSCLRVYHKSNLNDPLETFIISKDKNAKDLDGNNLYVEDVVNASNYIEASDNPGVGSLELHDVIVPQPLTQGNDGQAITTGDMIRALRYFENTSEHHVKFFGDGGYTVPAFQQRIEQLCRRRGDCFAVLSTPLSLQRNPDTSAQEVVNYRKYDLNLDSSWAGLYAPHLKLYDEFNDREVWCPPDGFAISAMLDTASNYEIWYPVAGNQRGKVNALDTRVHYTDGDQDLLYDNQVNPIIFDSEDGIKIWGQKTLTRQPSKLDRIHVRLLLITIGPALTKSLKSMLFEFNDEPTRATIRTIVNSYMEKVLAKRGVSRFKCVCDETNNLPIDLTNNRLNADLIICPNSSVEDINFTMAIVNETVSFTLAQQQI